MTRVRRLMAGLAAALAAAALAAPACAASPAAGLWATPEHDGKVQVFDCGGGLCGRIADGAELRVNPDVNDRMNVDPALRTRRLMGALIFDRLQGGPRRWTGRVYNPVDGRTYSGSVTLLSPDRLKLTGCIIFPLCKSQVWRRIG